MAISRHQVLDLALLGPSMNSTVSVRGGLCLQTFAEEKVACDLLCVFLRASLIYGDRRRWMLQRMMLGARWMKKMMDGRVTFGFGGML